MSDGGHRQAMRWGIAWTFFSLLLIGIAGSVSAQVPVTDPLPSWNEGEARRAILGFVDRVTQPGTPDFVSPPDRIAVFDNDGTLWAEYPLYSQGYFALDRIKALAPQHPEWVDQPPFAAVLKGDLSELQTGGIQNIETLLMVTHTGMTTDEFARIVREWTKTAQHPVLKRPYPQCVYQPMLELLTFLRSQGFRTFIVSGGGIDFMRPWTEQTYGVPPECVIGSSIKTEFEMRADGPVIMRLPEVDFIDDGPGKPVGIHRFIGRRPLAAFGNSDGDLQMLQWTTAGSGPRLGMIVHHTDARREFAYDRDSHVGKLDKALDEAIRAGWTVADMKNDWKTIFPGPEK